MYAKVMAVLMALVLCCAPRVRAAGNYILGSYPITPVEGPLTLEEVTSAIGCLGLRYERFSVELPEAAMLYLSIEQYADGEKLPVQDLRSMECRAGRQTITITDDRRFAGTLKLGADCREGDYYSGVVFDDIDIRGVKSSLLVQTRQAKLNERRKALLCVWAGKKAQTGIHLRGHQRLEETIAQNNFVVALFAEIAPVKGGEAVSPESPALTPAPPRG